MQSINSLSLAPAVNDWLANSRHPRILHVFDSACNLINERKEVLSIVTRVIGNGPFNLVIEEDILFSEHLKVESPISISGNQISLGDLSINTSSAELWNPRPDWEELHARRDIILNQLRTLPMTAYREASQWDQSSHSLLSAVAKEDRLSSSTATKQLAGLGAGLTPAGDDFLLGTMYAVWIIHPVELAKTITHEIANTAAPLTTSLSAAWLRSAGRGETGILWHEFFDALVSVGRIGNLTYLKTVQESIDKILAVGETSGADALSGFIGTFAAWMEKTGISNE